MMQFRNSSPFTVIFIATLFVFAPIVVVLFWADSASFESLHLVFDTANAVLSWLLAAFLLADQYQLESSLRKYLAIGFALAAAVQTLHALVGVEWSGAFAWVQRYSGTLRPATWPPASYLLPIALLWARREMGREPKLAAEAFAAGMLVISLVLFALALSLPQYLDTPVVGIRQPTQLPLLPLLLMVVLAYWRVRLRHPVFAGLALMSGLLLLSDLFILYSAAPHDRFAMMAHAGKLFAYVLMHAVLLTVTATNVQARTRAEADLLLEQDQLRATLEELKYQQFALDQHAIVGITDVQGNITYANDWFCTISGYTRAELLGSNHRILNSGTHSSEFFRDLYRTLAAGRVWSGEICNKSKYGHLYWVMTTIAPFMNQAGKPERYISIRSDITARKAAERVLLDSEQRFRDLVNTTDGIVWEADAQTFTFTFVSEQAERLLGFPLADWLMPGFWAKQLHPDDQNWAQDYCASSTGRLEPHDFEYRFIAQDGRTVWLHDMVTVVAENGAPKWLRGIMVDITRQKMAEAQIIASNNHLQAMLNVLPDLLFEVDQDGRIHDYHSSNVDLLAVPPERFLGETFTDVLPAAAAHCCLEAIHAAARQGRSHGHEYALELNGKTRWFEASAATMARNAGQGERFIFIARDITASKLASEEIQALAFYDPLTHLPNRRLMQDRVHQAQVSSAGTQQYGALLLIDLDNFKSLNDTLGHDVGDLLLVQVAERLVNCLREGDTVARLGGDEFVIILGDLDAPPLAALQVEQVAIKVKDTISKPCQLDVLLPDGGLSAHQHHCTLSIGIALFQGTDVSVDELLKRADTAMYQAKKAGRNTLCFYDPSMQAAVNLRAALEADLHRAVIAGQFELHYQVQVNARGEYFGAEVLVRWRHPEKGMIAPGQFIPLAEETGLILPIGYWILKTACEKLVEWARNPDMAHLSLSVNVSALQFALPHYVEEVLEILACTGANPEKLKLELTESLLLENAEGVIAKMIALKCHGVSFSLDDFGTGYSSLSYLKRLPLDQLKIDQSFVCDLLVDHNDAVIARTIVTLGHSLGLSVIAEGVESLEQRDFLYSVGCEAYQGYHFSKPLPVKDFEALVLRLPAATADCDCRLRL